MTSMPTALARRATDLLKAERAPSIPSPSPEERARTIDAIAATIAFEARARRRRRLVATMASAAAAILLVGSALFVRRLSASAADFSHERRSSISVVAQGAAQMYEWGRILGGRARP
jgi:hypothetical protein